MFPHQNFHKYAWTSPDEKIQNQFDHILINRRWYSSILDIRSFRGADCDTDYYLVVEKVRLKLAVSKQASQIFEVVRWNLGNSIILRSQRGSRLWRTEVIERV